ncbi:hypothetical protein DFS34DRAFT_20260 [Phlyctochytrium arcticum]|nr:hypothetical protein DFS34DRAFT_20260 [Phlyctochytrium arcticum]
MEQALDDFVRRLNDLKALAARHTPPSPLTNFTPTDPQYNVLLVTVTDLETQIAALRSRVEGEELALARAERLKEALRGQRTLLKSLASDGEPERDDDEVDQEETTSRVAKEREGSRGTRQPGGTSTSAKPKSRKILRESQANNMQAAPSSGGIREKGYSAGAAKPKDVKSYSLSPEKAPVKSKTSVEHITEEEFNSLPKYIVGRLTLSRVNTHIDDFNALLKDKQALLQLSPPKMTKPQRDVYWEHKKIATNETKGKVFVTEKDTKDKAGWSTSAFRMDPTGRSVVAIMRHLKRIKEVRGGGHTRLVVT